MKHNKVTFFCLIILFLIVILLGVLQTLSSPDKKIKQLKAQAEQNLVAGNYLISLNRYQSLLDLDPFQTGIRTIIKRLTEIDVAHDKSGSDDDILELGQELIRQKKFRLAMLMYQSLIKTSPQFLFRAEKDMAIIKWWRGDNPNEDNRYESYKSENLPHLYKLLYIHVYPPRIISQNYIYDKQTKRFTMQIVLDRVYPEHIFRMDWVTNQEIMQTQQWNFSYFKEYALLQSTLEPCPKSFFFYFFHKNRLLWLEQGFEIKDGKPTMVWSNDENFRKHDEHQNI